MSIRFSGGERFQRGRGIGGLLRLAKGLFKPVIKLLVKLQNLLQVKLWGEHLRIKPLKLLQT